MARRALSRDSAALGTCALALGALLRGEDSEEADAGALVLASFVRSFLVRKE